MIVYEIITGNKPFPRMTEYLTTEAIMKHKMLVFDAGGWSCRT